MVAEMLRVDPATAADLVPLIEPHSSGDPFETVELVNALRRDGVLTATPEGWRWDEAAVRARLGKSEVRPTWRRRLRRCRRPLGTCSRQWRLWAEALS